MNMPYVPGRQTYRRWDMTKNMGVVDRIVRILLAIVIAILYFTDKITGLAAVILAIIAIILLLTGLVGVCPLYYPLKISTKGKKKEAGKDEIPPM